MPPWLFDWLSQPLWVILTFSMLMGLPWLRRKWRRWRGISWRLGAVLAVYLILISPPVVAWGIQAIASPLPADPGGTADAIVMLGRGDPMRPGRTDLAAELWRQKRAPLIVASGIYDAPRMVKELRAQGIPATALVGEECSRDTWENALFTAAILLPQGKRTIILVTDAPHLWRSHMIYESFGFIVIPIASPLPSSSTDAQNGLLLQRELWLLGKFPQDQAKLGPTQQPSVPAAAQKMTQQRCYIDPKEQG
jgi:uncharacterized SAM-binding protein YcdF (DUF218 family)